MYGERVNKEKQDEDSIDSPFTELEIIKNSLDKRMYYFMIGPKPGLSSELIVSCCLDYASALNRPPEEIEMPERQASDFFT